MGTRRQLAILTVILALALGALACEGGSGAGSGGGGRPVSPFATPTPRFPSSLELAARETTIARETVAAMEHDARRTAEALANQAQATRQALDLQGTQQAQEASATREAWAFAQTQEAAAAQATVTAEDRQATATRQALDATATRQALDVTSTAGAIRADVEETRQAGEAAAIRATTDAIQARAESERATDWLRTFAPWALAALGIAAAVLVGWRFAKVAEDRARVVRRQADEGEPFVLLEQTDEEGNRRIALPLRSFNALMDTGDVPALPAPEHQDAATMRQQTANAIQARQVGQIAKAKSKAPRVIAGTARALPGPRPARQRRQVPGLVRVVSVGSLEEAAGQGILPPRLARAIDGQWRVVEED